MHLSAVPFRRLFVLALLAWAGMVLTLPLPAMQTAPAMATTLKMKHAAPMSHAGQPVTAHCANASAAGYDCCGHAQPVCSGGYCCGCVSVCGAAVLPVTALSMQTSRGGCDLLRLRRPALAPMITAPPLRPPAA